MRPWSRCSMAALVVTLGCGGGSAVHNTPPDAAPDAAPDAHVVTASDYDGLWLMTSITLPQQGAYLTVLRDGDPESIRGDAMFGATDAAHGMLLVRQVLLDAGLIASPIYTGTENVTLEPGQWVITDGDGKISVFSTDLSADHLVLELADDPRTTATSPPREIVLDRAPPWNPILVGTWDLVSMELPSQTVTAGDCVEVQAGTSWAIMEMQVVFDMRLLFERTMTMTTYSDDACSVQTDQQQSLQDGLAEVDSDGSVRLWGVENQQAEYQAFSMNVVGDTVTLTRTDCLPKPDCTTGAPLQVVVVQH